MRTEPPRHKPSELCDCPNPQPDRPFHCAAAPPRDVAGVLRFAATLIELHGWCQGTPPPRDHRLPGRLPESRPMDITTAIATAIAGWPPVSDELLDGDALALYTSARRAVLDKIGRGDWLLIEWNDTPGRTAREVIELLRAAAVAAAPDDTAAVETPAP